jgi:hypothetical protein
LYGVNRLIADADGEDALRATPGNRLVQKSLIPQMPVAQGLLSTPFFSHEPQAADRTQQTILFLIVSNFVNKMSSLSR